MSEIEPELSEKDDSSHFGDGGSQGVGEALLAHSGFVAVVGRPNVGKSTLVNAIVGTKVSITSPRPSTTRRRVLGVLERPGVQAIFVDTPGIHRPRGALGTRLNQAAKSSLNGVDVVLIVVDATAPVGPGDRFVASAAPEGSIAVVNKIDRARPLQALEQLQAASLMPLSGGSGGVASECFPVSARTGRGIKALVDTVVSLLPRGPRYFPAGMTSDSPEAFWVAELVREQILKVVDDELPHSIACVVTGWDWPHIKCEILVERDSQKPIVIGRGGCVLKAVGQAVRTQLPDGAYLELLVRVERDWQRRSSRLDELGYTL
ncbi:MAG: GTPase Era [Actinobacteria bacterium]|nr:GTPase Era [Actinomycetota bacterium]